MISPNLDAATCRLTDQKFHQLEEDLDDAHEASMDSFIRVRQALIRLHESVDLDQGVGGYHVAIGHAVRLAGSCCRPGPPRDGGFTPSLNTQTPRITTRYPRHERTKP